MQPNHAYPSTPFINLFTYQKLGVIKFWDLPETCVLIINSTKSLTTPTLNGGVNWGKFNYFKFVDQLAGATDNPKFTAWLRQDCYIFTYLRNLLITDGTSNEVKVLELLFSGRITTSEIVWKSLLGRVTARMVVRRLLKICEIAGAFVDLFLVDTFLACHFLGLYYPDIIPVIKGSTVVYQLPCLPCQDLLKMYRRIIIATI